MHGLDGRVHVAIRHADGRGGDAAALEKNRVRIGAGTAGIDAALKGDLVLYRDILEPLHQHGMVHAAAAEDRALAELACRRSAFLFVTGMSVAWPTSMTSAASGCTE